MDVSRDLDLCPMCSGEGKHNLQPLDGLFIRIVNILEVKNLTNSSLASYNGPDIYTLARQKIRNEYIKIIMDAGFRNGYDYTNEELKTIFLNFLVSKGYEITFMTADGMEFILKWRWI